MINNETKMNDRIHEPERKKKLTDERTDPVAKKLCWSKQVSFENILYDKISKQAVAEVVPSSCSVYVRIRFS